MFIIVILLKFQKQILLKLGAEAQLSLLIFFFFTNLKSHHSFGKPEPDRVIKKQLESDRLKMNVDPQPSLPQAVKKADS